MEKINIGEIKTTIRSRKGVEQVIRLFTKGQQRLIQDIVKNRPDDKTVEDVLKIYDISPAVFYSWKRKTDSNKDGKIVFIETVNPKYVDVEDNGCAKITTISNGEIDEGIFVRIQSWSDNKVHQDFDRLIGKKVKVTIEIID